MRHLGRANFPYISLQRNANRLHEKCTFDSGRRLTLLAESLGLEDRVTLLAGTTFFHKFNSLARLPGPTRPVIQHTEHAQLVVSVDQ